MIGCELRKKWYEAMNALLKKFLLYSKNISKDTYIWNALSSMLNSFQTLVLLMVITRSGTAEDSSIFVMAYAVGNLLFNIGKYGVRQFQVTDAEEKYSFQEYLSARRASMIMMLAAVFAYLGWEMGFGNYSVKKAAVVLAICLYKGIEAYEDVYLGRLQQRGRLDIAGKIIGLRLFLFIIGFALVYLSTGNLLAAAYGNMLLSGLFCFWFLRLAGEEYADDHVLRPGRKKQLLSECAALCVSMVLNMYMGNAPKYIIDSVVSDEAQTAFNIVYMPLFIISMLGVFIFQPSLHKMGHLWTERKIPDLRRLLIKLAAVVVFLDIAAVAAGAVLGIPVLELLYGVDLKDYRSLLILFLIISGILTIMNLLVMTLTTLRCQRQIFIGYAFFSVILFVFGKSVLVKAGLNGMSLFYLMVMCLMDVYCLLIAAWKMHGTKRTDRFFDKKNVI